MNYALVCKLLSIILMALTIAFAASFEVALLFDWESGDAAAELGFFFSAGASGITALALFFIGRRASNLMFRKEALAVVGLGWITASLFGALPYYLILPQLSPASALFESASGLTTTGGSVLSELESLPRSLLFWRAISQWIGGLGVVVFFVAVLSFLGAGAKVLFSRESSAQSTELDATRVQQGIIRLMLLYLGLSVLCVVGFLLCGLNFFEAMTHMFTTVSTGGFSTRSASVEAFANPALEWTMVVFMALGGTAFIPMIRTLRGHGPAIFRSTEVRWFYTIMLFAIVLVSLFLLLDPSFSFDFHTIIRTATFQVVSIMTTTGFSTDDFDQWLPVTHVILLILMLIGGCSGSTSGGAKVIRVVIAWNMSVINVERAFRARVVRTLRINGEPVDSATQESVLVFLVLLGGVGLSSMLGVAILEPTLSLEGTASTVLACLFNIGPGFDEVGPARNFAPFSEVTKVLLSLLMILGRVELFAVLALFAPSLWKKF